jgi:hypothetical protein
LRDQNTYFAFLYKTKIGNACVRVSECASHVGRLSWRRTLRGSTRDLIPTRSTTWTPPPLVLFPIKFLQPRELHPHGARRHEAQEVGSSRSPAPRRRRRARRRHPIRGAADGGDEATAPPPTSTTPPHKTPPTELEWRRRWQLKASKPLIRVFGN